MIVRVNVITKTGAGKDLLVSMLKCLFNFLGGTSVKETTEDDGRWQLDCHVTVPLLYKWHAKLGKVCGDDKAWIPESKSPIHEIASEKKEAA